MNSKVCVVCKIEKSFNNFTTNIENVNSVILKEVQDVTMIIKTKYQFNRKYIMERIEINFYRNKMNTETKETQIIKNYKDPMMKYKIN